MKEWMNAWMRSQTEACIACSRVGPMWFVRQALNRTLRHTEKSILFWHEQPSRSLDRLGYRWGAKLTIFLIRILFGIQLAFPAAVHLGLSSVKDLQLKVLVKWMCCAGSPARCRLKWRESRDHMRSRTWYLCARWHEFGRAVRLLQPIHVCSADQARSVSFLIWSCSYNKCMARLR